jgi:hypothetical protein
MSMTLSRFMMTKCTTVLLASIFIGGAATLAQADCKAEYYNHYLKKPGHKAMAVTGGRSPLAKGISCGTAWDFPTIEKAINEALRQCRVSDRKYGDPGICQIVKVK